MASGSSGLDDNVLSKVLFFENDEIFCSYEDYVNQENANNGINSSEEVHKSRMTRSSMFPASTHSPPEESFNQDVITAVDRTMKKYADNLMRFLEGMSSRLSQLELYCYNLDKSIGEMRSDLVHDHGDADSKLKFLQKHLQEVHRSVQILRDEQELSETQKELAKLQLAQKESSSGSNSQPNEERATAPVSDPKKTQNTSDVHGQQFSLALPHELAQQSPHEQQQAASAPPSVPPQSMTQSQAYYLPPQNSLVPSQVAQDPYLPSNSQYQTPQMQEISRVAPQPAQSQVNQTPHNQPLPQYQQQWPQHSNPPQQPSMQAQMRPSSAAVCPSYLQSQPANISPPEMLPSSNMPIQVPFSGVPQPGVSRAEAMPYRYGGAGRMVQPQPPSLKAAFGALPGDGHAAAQSHSTLSPGNGYMMFETEGGRVHHHPPQHPHFTQSGYPRASVPLQNPQPNTSTNVVIRPQQFMRNHPYNELIEKLVNMGYRGDHVVSLIRRLEESGQPVDFNAVLDRLNGDSSGGSQRGWSG